MTQPCQGPDPNPRRPALAAPPGTCDCHFHIFGPNYPFVAERSFTPPEAPVEAYEHVMATLGIERCVIVQPSVYGTDNACTLDAMARLGPRCRGVAVIDETVSAEQLERMHAAGVRGVRFNLLYKGGVGLEALAAVADRIAELGWHVQLLIDGRDLPGLAGRLRALPTDVVIDHMGHIPAAELEHPGNRTLLDLVRGRRCWVKLSGTYRISTRAPRYADAAPLARALIAAAPDRMVWGTDWPHPALEGAMPNDGALMDLIADWTDDGSVRRGILVDNPAALYGF